jgi:outer membrane protein assembly factor BamB
MRSAIALFLVAVTADARVRAVRKPVIEPVVQYRGDTGRTGVVPGSGPRAFTRVAWQTSIGSASFSAPVYANGRVYASAGNGRIVALDAATGATRWTSEPLGAFTSPVTVAHDAVYVSGENKRTYALNLANGTTLWSFLADDWSVGAPLVANGMMFLGTEARSVYAIDVATRAQLWRFATSEPVHSTLALDEGRLFITAINTLYALNATTGQELWRKQRDGAWFNFSVSDGVVFATASDGGVYAIDAHTGIERWHVVSPNTFWTEPSVLNGIVILTNDARRVVALDALTGVTRWTREVADVPTEAILADAVVYVGTGTPQATNHNVERRVYAFEAATGTELFSALVIGHVYTGVAVGEGTLFVMTSRGQVSALQ